MGAVVIIAFLWRSTGEDRGMKSAYKRNMEIKVKSKVGIETSLFLLNECLLKIERFWKC